MRGLHIWTVMECKELGITPAHAGLTFSQPSELPHHRDHPRACGAYVLDPEDIQTRSGSPPRMRGLRLVVCIKICAVGITPAHAGLTKYATALRCVERDHPRACGAYLQAHRRKQTSRGSPPRMRGLPTVLFKLTDCSGITPAHAGLTQGPSRQPFVYRDHPRACGAYSSAFSGRSSVLGSPPRMRGLPDCRIWAGWSSRITPAHAGLTARWLQQRKRSRDHPRACGAYYPSVQAHDIELGSPPRMRGLLDRWAQHQARAGITPAHAGLTSVLGHDMNSDWDHPRACGAYFTSARWTMMMMGSPPRMRGLRTISYCRPFFAGITPAHAGLTLPGVRENRSTRDHPRACGAYPLWYRVVILYEGSPPRMRGLLGQPGRNDKLVGITPAHAGLTVTDPNNNAIPLIAKSHFYLVC